MRSRSFQWLGQLPACPEDAQLRDGQCVCNDAGKYFDQPSNTCRPIAALAVKRETSPALKLLGLGILIGISILIIRGSR